MKEKKAGEREGVCFGGWEMWQLVLLQDYGD